MKRYTIINKQEVKTIKEWELETGIKIIKPNGFRGEKNKLHSNKYTKKAFKRGVKKSFITSKTEKGLEFIKSL